MRWIGSVLAIGVVLFSLLGCRQAPPPGPPKNEPTPEEIEKARAKAPTGAAVPQ